MCYQVSYIGRHLLCVHQIPKHLTPEFPLLRSLNTAVPVQLDF